MTPTRFLVGLTLGAFTACTPAGIRTPEVAPEVESLRVNGYDMTYVERGTGEPVLLVHGSLSDYRYWLGVMEPLSAKYRVVAVSLRHYYPERWEGDGDFSMRQHIADVAAFIRALGLRRVHLVGASRGGSLSLYLASAHADLVRTLTVAEFGAIPAFDTAAATTAARWKEMVVLLERGAVDEGVGKFIDYVNGPGSWQAIPEARREPFRDNAWTARGEARDKWPPFSCADAGRIDVPVLLVGGERSPPRFASALDALQGCLTRPERVVVRNASHGIPRQNPAGFSAAVLVFLAKH
jgi:pimeloyl-ACP methyl ester carboxylesterase